MSWKLVVSIHHSLEIGELVSCGELAENEQEYSLLKGKSSLSHCTVYYVLNVHAAVEKLTVAGHVFAVSQLVLTHVGNGGESCENALTVGISESSFYVIKGVKIGVYRGIIFTHPCEIIYFVAC